MIPIRSHHLDGLEWRQPASFSRLYELRSGTEDLARLEFKKTFGPLAEAAAADGNWTFTRSGFLSPTVKARVKDGGVDIASYHPNWTARKGKLELAGGEICELRSDNLRCSEWVLWDAGKEALLRFHTKGALHHGATVDVAEKAREREDLSLLLTLVWYVLVLHMNDSVAVPAT